MTYYGINYDSSFQHHGIKGMKWGIRRYQNADGTLTDAGKKRYAKQQRKLEKIIKSGDYKKIMKNKSRFSDEQLDKAYTRLGRMDKITSLEPEKNSLGKRFVEAARKTSESLETVYNSYTKIAKVTDALGITNKLANKKFGKYSEDERAAAVNFLINQASALDVYRRKNELSGADMAKALSRIRAEEQLWNQLTPEEQKTYQSNTKSKTKKRKQIDKITEQIIRDNGGVRLQRQK